MSWLRDKPWSQCSSSALHPHSHSSSPYVPCLLELMFSLTTNELRHDGRPTSAPQLSKLPLMSLQQCILDLRLRLPNSVSKDAWHPKAVYWILTAILTRKTRSRFIRGSEQVAFLCIKHRLDGTSSAGTLSESLPAGFAWRLSFWTFPLVKALRNSDMCCLASLFVWLSLMSSPPPSYQYHHR